METNEKASLLQQMRESDMKIEGGFPIISLYYEPLLI
jgi:hypothetical protein